MRATAALAAPAGRDDDEFADAVAAHYDEALRLAWLLAGDRHRAEDAVGEALAKTLRRWRRQPIRNPRAYIRRAVVNEVNSGLRSLVRDRRGRERRTGEGRGDRGPDERVADQHALMSALARLPGRQRTAVVLFYYEDLSQEQTAKAMGCAVGTVKSNLSRGLDNLREVLDGEVDAR